MQAGYANPFTVAAQTEDVRAAFIRKTYIHLAIAIAAFAGLEAILLQIPAVTNLAGTMVNGYNWLIVMGLFMAVSYVADKWASSATSLGMQYAGLALTVVAWAILFLPILVIASIYSAQAGGENLIGKAALYTGLLVAALTTIVFTTKKDFSFMRSFLIIGSFVAFGLIIASIFFKFDLGWIFAAAMILFAAGSILYTTSNILHHYRTDQYVAGSVALFAGVALLFYYILMLLLRTRD